MSIYIVEISYCVHDYMIYIYTTLIKWQVIFWRCLKCEPLYSSEVTDWCWCRFSWALSIKLWTHTHNHTWLPRTLYLVAQCQRNWGSGKGNQFFTFFLLRPPCRGHIVTHIHDFFWISSTGHFLNKVLHWNFTQFLIQGIGYHKNPSRTAIISVYISSVTTTL